MTDTPEPEYEADLDDGRPDPSDAVIAWYFGTRELASEEYARFSNSHRRDFARGEAAREADARYAAWKAENPEAAAEHEAACDAASRRWMAETFGPAHEPEPDPELEAG
jgi:hypothetical protein